MSSGSRSTTRAFTIGGIHDKQHANFYRRMLAIALNRFKYGD